MTVDGAFSADFSGWVGLDAGLSSQSRYIDSDELGRDPHLVVNV